MADWIKVVKRYSENGNNPWIWIVSVLRAEPKGVGRNYMEQPKKKNTFVFQAGILAAAGMLVKVISLIYRSPLLSIIGIEGNGYYSAAINIYTIILLISSYSIPSAISKVIAQRLAFKEYRNAQRVFICALLYVLIVGGAASVLTFVGAPWLVRENPNAVVALRVLSPTIFFSGFLGVLRGYFQAHSSMVHTSISQVLEQIMNAVISILAAHLLIGLVIDGDRTTRAIYGSAGSAIGTGAGVLTGLLFMFGMYRLNRKIIQRRVERDQSWHEETYGQIFKVIFTVVTPFILSTFIYNCSTVINMTIYYNIMDAKQVDDVIASNHYGIFATQAVAVINIPIAIASAMSSAMMPGVSASYARGGFEQTRRQVSKAIQMTMLIAIPAVVGMAVLPKPIMQFIFPQKESLDIASGLLAALSVTIVLYGLSTLTNAVLQGIGKVNTPVIHGGIALVFSGSVRTQSVVGQETFGVPAGYCEVFLKTAPGGGSDGGSGFRRLSWTDVYCAGEPGSAACCDRSGYLCLFCNSSSDRRRERGRTGSLSERNDADSSGT